MNRVTLPGRTTVAAIAFLFANPCLGLSAEASSAASPKTQPSEEISRVAGLFDVDLPKTIERLKGKVITNPRFGDLLRHSYMRLPVGVRLGLNDRTEINGEVVSYFTHGFRRRKDGYGLGLLRLGTKYQWAEWLKPSFQTSTGVNITIPTGRPPRDMTDGLEHFSPYISLSRRFEALPRATPFASFNVDLVRRSSVPGRDFRNLPQSDSMGMSVGYLYDFGATFKYTLVTNYWTTAGIGRGSMHCVALNPSILWQLPPRLKFHSPSRWVVGFGIKIQRGPDGTDFSSSAQLQGEFDFKRLFR